MSLSQRHPYQSHLSQVLKDTLLKDIFLNSQRHQPQRHQSQRYLLYSFRRGSLTKDESLFSIFSNKLVKTYHLFLHAFLNFKNEKISSLRQCLILACNHIYKNCDFLVASMQYTSLIIKINCMWVLCDSTNNLLKLNQSHHSKSIKT